LAPSQWGKLLPALSERYFTVLLGGLELGILPILEHRGRSAGFQRLHRNMLHELQPQSGETILDVGCGTGVLDQWLAENTARQNPIVAVDMNAYFLHEAAARLRREGLASTIELREGNATALPFEDNSFALVISTTVMEEVDADVMLAELVRVTKPAGRIGVIVRATDVPRPSSLRVRPELKLKCEAPRGDIGTLGCASADLYRRFYQSGLTGIRVLPVWTVFSDVHGVVEEFMLRAVIADLMPDEAAEWRSAAERTMLDGTFFLTWPHHCAVGTKPA